MKEKPIFFASSEAFRQWLSKNYNEKTEQWVGYYKKATLLPSMTWSESVDQALCFGWIDGIRKSIDTESYKIRFTPRKASSNWSAINIRKMEELIKEGLMTEAGLKAFDKKQVAKSKVYSYEQKNAELPPAYLEKLKSHQEAYIFFHNLPPSARKPSIWWVISAKKEETRQRRLEQLMACCAQGVRIPMLRVSGK
ncbi:MAG: YdeI/OmpD-associated family protein [Saprospiraceae bacterium]|nr:YdeI/OmpD-associated family protein [Saprospiraceae bacterium]